MRTVRWERPEAAPNPFDAYAGDHRDYLVRVCYASDVAEGEWREVFVPFLAETLDAAAKSSNENARRVVFEIDALEAVMTCFVTDDVRSQDERDVFKLVAHDWAFVAWQQRDAIAQYGGANLVIALDRADGGNGGFEVLSGTHAGGPVKFDYDTAAMNVGAFDESRRTLIPLDPGDAVVFHPHLAHGSGPKHSPLQRRLVALWFIGAAPRPPG